MNKRNIIILSACLFGVLILIFAILIKYENTTNPDSTSEWIPANYSASSTTDTPVVNLPEASNSYNGRLATIPEKKARSLIDDFNSGSRSVKTPFRDSDAVIGDIRWKCSYMQMRTDFYGNLSDDGKHYVFVVFCDEYESIESTPNYNEMATLTDYEIVDTLEVKTELEKQNNKWSIIYCSYYSQKNGKVKIENIFAEPTPIS